jgi:hypothetical protein
MANSFFDDDDEEGEEEEEDDREISRCPSLFFGLL